MAQTIKLKRSATQGAAPTTSNLALGEVAINTYDGKMYIKKSVGGTESIVEVGGANTVSYLEAGMIEYEYTATSNQTTFSGSDSNSATLSYTANSILVFLNGVLQDDGVDYTATNGTSVVFSSALTANDEVRIVAFTNVTTSGSLQDPTKLDTITTVNAQAAYSLTLNSSAYTPSSQNALIVSLNGITQEPGDSFTISGSTITFSPALVTGDVVDYIVDMGRAVTIGQYDSDLVVTGDITPGTDSTYDLGASGTEWANVYADTFTGNLTGNVTGTVSSLSNHDTDDLSEGSTNLYHTTERVQDVTGGQFVTNGTHTGISFAYDDANDGAIDATVSLASFDTDDLSEGSTNLYYTDARVDSRLASGSVGNIVTTGYIAGPSTFTIDPAAVGDNTGTLVVAGNLQVDGTTTTINSTTMTVDDLNITLASGAANAAAANGAGITVDGASATLTYNGTNDDWNFNKGLNVTGDLTVDTNTLYIDSTNNRAGINNTNPKAVLHVGGEIISGAAASTSGQVILKSEYLSSSNDFLNILGTQRSNSAWVLGYGVKPSPTTSGVFLSTADNSNFKRGALVIQEELIFMNSASQQTAVDSTVTLTERMRIDSDGNVGIGNDNPDARLTVDTDQQLIARLASSNVGITGVRLQGIDTSANDNVYVDWFYDAENRQYGFGEGTASGSLPINSGIGEADIVFNNGNVRIPSEVGLSSLSVTTNPLTLGNLTSFNLAFDSNEIQARNNGASNNLILNKNGGTVAIGAAETTGGLYITTDQNRTIILDGTFPTGSFTWQSIKRSGVEKFRWFLNNNDSMSLYSDAGSTYVQTWLTDGKVGIGTNGPSYILDVDVGAPASSDQVLGRFSSQNGVRDIGFVWDDSASTLGIATLTNHALTFHTNGNSNERMRIDSSGNVGIGVVGPNSVHGGKVLQVSSGTGAEVIVHRNDAGVALNDYIGGFLFYNGDGSGAPPHYSGMIGKASNIYGSTNLEFYAGRAALENHASTAPHMVISGDSNDDSNVGIGIVPTNVGSYKTLEIGQKTGGKRGRIQFNTNSGNVTLYSFENGTQPYLGIYTDHASGTYIGRFDSDGLKFGSDTAAANALDDYEEGTWTPKFWYASSSSDQRHFTGGDSEVDLWGNSSRYTKIGDLVTCWFDITNFSLTSSAWSALSSAGSFNLSTDGLPFTVSDRDKLAGTFTTGTGIGQYNGRNITGTLQGLYHFREIVAFVVSRMDSTSSSMSRASVGNFVDLSGSSGQFRGVFQYRTTD